MIRLAWAIAASLLAAAPLCAQPPIALEPGDAVTLHVDGRGTVEVSPRTAAEWTPFDLAAARHLSGLTPPGRPDPYATEIPRDDNMPAVPPVEPDMIRVKFLSIAGRHSLLVMENGYGQAIAYRARMTRGGRTTPTDVCLVVPNYHGFEHWPDPLDRIEISDIHFVPWQRGEPVPCA